VISLSVTHQKPRFASLEDWHHKKMSALYDQT